MVPWRVTLNAMRVGTCSLHSLYETEEQGSELTGSDVSGGRSRQMSTKRRCQASCSLVRLFVRKRDMLPVKSEILSFLGRRDLTSVGLTSSVWLNQVKLRSINRWQRRTAASPPHKRYRCYGRYQRTWSRVNRIDRLSSPDPAPQRKRICFSDDMGGEC